MKNAPPPSQLSGRCQTARQADNQPACQPTTQPASRLQSSQTPKLQNFRIPQTPEVPTS